MSCAAPKGFARGWRGRDGGIERERLILKPSASHALELITEAMDLLDAHDGPPDAAAHLAVAQQRLRQALARDVS